MTPALWIDLAQMTLTISLIAWCRDLHKDWLALAAQHDRLLTFIENREKTS